jgi:hypothetical protein
VSAFDLTNIAVGRRHDNAAAALGMPLRLTGLRRDFPLSDLLQASDLGKLWISPDFRPRM